MGLHDRSPDWTSFGELTKPFGSGIQYQDFTILLSRLIPKLIHQWLEWLKEFGVNIVQYINKEYKLHEYGERPMSSIQISSCDRTQNHVGKNFELHVDTYLFLSSAEGVSLLNGESEQNEEPETAKFRVDVGVPFQPQYETKQTLTLIYKIIYDSRKERWWDPGADADTELPGSWKN